MNLRFGNASSSRAPQPSQTAPKSRRGGALSAAALGALSALAATAALAAFPASAAAHGPIAPIASAYLARITTVPAGIQAQVIDADQRMWLQVAPDRQVVVLDTVGAPFVRFDASGVAVNHNSSMFYANEIPAQLPPPGVTRSTPPHWVRVSGGHTYSWHDGRLHALATVALAPGASYAGRWTIPMRVDGRAAAIAGGLWHRPSPSPAWFWPIAVILACALAAWRVRDPALDERSARLLGSVALTATVVAALGRELHGRPDVTVLQLLTLAVVVAFAGWAARAVVARTPGWFTLFLIAAVSIWEGVKLLPTLVDGYVLAAVPAVAARIACVGCLGAGGALLLFVIRLADQRGGAELDEGELLELDPHESYA
jgi:hypothetical protein